MSEDRLLQLNPDAFSRFQLVCSEIKMLYGSKKIKLLDIGGASTYLYDFLDFNNINFDLTIVDIIEFDNKPKKATVIIQSAEDMSFNNGEFDVVTGIDMLEHIPNEIMKRNIINEAIRVSRDLVIFAGPCDDKPVTEYEKHLNDQNKLLFSQDQKWLAEHFRYGKPSKKLLGECFDAESLSKRVFSILPLQEWYLSSIANLMPSVNGAVAASKLQSLNKKYNARFFDHGIRIPENFEAAQGYRTFFIGSKLQKLADPEFYKPSHKHAQVERYIDIMAEALNGTKAYVDNEKDLVWYKSENERLEKEIKDLRESNYSLSMSKDALSGGKIVHGARVIEGRIHRKGQNDR